MASKRNIERALKFKIGTTVYWWPYPIVVTMIGTQRCTAPGPYVSGEIIEILCPADLNMKTAGLFKIKYNRCSYGSTDDASVLATGISNIVDGDKLRLGV